MALSVRIGTAVLLINLIACSTPPQVRGIINQIGTPTKFTEPADTTPPPAPLAQVAQAAKPKHHGKKPEPKPEPTLDELVQYLRGRMIAVSPSDGSHDNLEVIYNPATTALVITQPDGRCEQFLNALDPNSLAWDIVDLSDSHNSREQLLRLTVTSLSGKTARACYDKTNHFDSKVTGNRARFLFSLTKVEQFPGFQDNITKTVKKLIVASGGAPDKPLFKEDAAKQN